MKTVMRGSIPDRGSYKYIPGGAEARNPVIDLANQSGTSVSHILRIAEFERLKSAS